MGNPGGGNELAGLAITTSVATFGAGMAAAAAPAVISAAATHPATATAVANGAVEIGAGEALGGASLSAGVLVGAKYAQKTFSATFSAEGKFAGQTVSDVASALSSGAMKASDVPINYIVREGQTIMLNTRSAQALEAAGVPRSQWEAINQTGNSLYEQLLNGQLMRNPGAPFSAVRPAGTP